MHGVSLGSPGFPGFWLRPPKDWVRLAGLAYLPLELLAQLVSQAPQTRRRLGGH